MANQSRLLSLRLDVARRANEAPNKHESSARQFFGDLGLSE